MSNPDGSPSLVPNPKNLPSPDQGQPPAVRPGSGMAVVGVFVEVIRERFRATGTNWLYNDDIKKTTIAVDRTMIKDRLILSLRLFFGIGQVNPDCAGPIMTSRHCKSDLNLAHSPWAVAPYAAGS